MDNTNWSPETWKAINDAIAGELKIRTGQQVFPTDVLVQHSGTLQDEEINIDDLSISEDSVPFVELHVNFSLTETQYHQEETLGTCKTLARMAAKEIALAEDAIIYSGAEAKFSGKVQPDRLGSAGKGLLGKVVDKEEIITVEKLTSGRPGLLYGENVFTKVAEGIAKLIEKGQAPKYALFLPTKVYADTFVPPGDSSLVTTAERIKPLVEGGFIGTGTLPENKGLLVALGGDPVVIYIDREAYVEEQNMTDGKHIFKVAERFQFMVRDRRALVRLDFE